MVTDCVERRAICNFCGVFCLCSEMIEHQKYCGSRSEQCTVCSSYVTLANMEQHLLSSCLQFTNKQKKASPNPFRNISSNNNHNNDNNDSNIINPYLDTSLLTASSMPQMVFGPGVEPQNNVQRNISPAVNLSDFQTDYQPAHKSILDTFGNASNKKRDDTIIRNKDNNDNNDDNNDDDNDVSPSSSSGIEVCPHCAIDILFDDYGEFSMHIATKHITKIDDILTQDILHRLQKTTFAENVRQQRIINQSETNSNSNNKNNKNTKEEESNDNNDDHTDNNERKQNTNTNIIHSDSKMFAESISNALSKKSSKATKTQNKLKNTKFRDPNNKSDKQVKKRIARSKFKDKTKNKNSFGMNINGTSISRSNTKQRWPCTKCTYLNAGSKRFCTMCNARKPILK
jgi:hypothetical protein